MTEIDKAISEAVGGAEAPGLLPFESWERLEGETSAAFDAFRSFRDFGAGRNIRRAVESAEPDERARAKKYRVWRNWAAKNRWKERAGDYDRYAEKLRLAEARKTIEAQGEMHRAVTGKMLEVAKKKLDTMDAAELTQGNLTDWVEAAIKAEREAAGLAAAGGAGAERNRGEVAFVNDFQGL